MKLRLDYTTHGLLLIIITLNIFRPLMLYSVVLLQGIFYMLQGAAADATMTLLVVEGILITTVTIALSLCRNFRELESELPDYKY